MTKKKIVIAFTLVICFLLNVFNMEVKAAPQIKITVQTGIENIQQEGKNLPITIVLENSGDDFRGDVVVNTGYSSKGGHALVKTVNLAKGESETVRFLAEKYTHGEGKNKVLLYKGSYEDGKEMTYSGSGVIEEPTISEEKAAVLSLDYSKKEIDSLTILAAENHDIVYKNKNGFNAPTDARYLDSIAIMMVKNETLTTWTEEQQQVLLEWVKNGGVLYIQGKAAVPEFMEKNLPFNLTEEEKAISTSQLSSYLKTVDIEAGIISYGVTRNEGSEIILGDSSQPLLGKMAVGAGEIIQGNFKNWPVEQGQASAIAAALFSEISTIDNGALGNALLNLENSTELYPTFHFSAILLMLILLAYILIIAPLLYIILKQKDKREYAWWIIPLGAIITSLGIFTFSSFGRISKSTVQQASITTLNDGHASTQFAHSLLTNKSGDIPVTATSNTYLSRVTDNMETKKNYKNAVLRKSKEKSTLNILGLRYWDIATVLGEKTVKDFGKLTTTLTISNGYLTGEIKNDLDYKLVDVEVWSGNKKYKIGKIAEGETVKVNQKVKELFLTSPQQPMDTYIEMPSNKEELVKYQLASIEQGVLDNNVRNDKPLVVGWVKSDLVKLTYEKLKTQTSSNNIIIQSFIPGLDIEKDVFINEGSFNIQETNINGEGYMDIKSNPDAWDFGKGQYQLDYAIPKALSQSKITWQELQFNYYPEASFTMEIFNFKTAKYEELKEKETTFNKSVTDYISQTNKLRFKAVKHQEDGITVKKPKIQMKGAKKDD